MSIDQTWLDRNAAWWARLDRAEVPAVGSGSGEQFRAGYPYEVAPEPTDTPDRVAYGGPQASSPVAISTMVGDIVHNFGIRAGQPRPRDGVVSPRPTAEGREAQLAHQKQETAARLL